MIDSVCICWTEGRNLVAASLHGSNVRCRHGRAQNFGGEYQARSLPNIQAWSSSPE